MRESGRAWDAPRTPNLEYEAEEESFGKYGHMEPCTPDSAEVLRGKYGHMAPDTPVSLGFQTGIEEHSPGDDGIGLGGYEAPETPIKEDDKWEPEEAIEPTHLKTGQRH